jgi:hypothetical protein
VRSDYLFFRRFTAFFAFFAFLFLAIAALLATVCGDVGTVPSRIDVHYIPITPTRQQKTLTPLNGACTEAQTPSAIANVKMRDAAADAANGRAAASPAMRGFDSVKTHMSSAFSRVSSRQTFVSRAGKNLCHPQLT